ncbi:RNA methyltransferase [Rapidithrix thailandica]|uniref:RNA methyltransferase n=1 Tax=Rapidithrix thailandica TaxID=413964 RepID=A0AAW9S256_9BACT
MRKLAVEELNRVSVEEYKETPKNKLVVLLDSVRSLNNVGSAFRTSDAFCIEKLYLCGITGTPPHRDIHKTALGATESVDWEHRKDIVQTVKELKEEGYTIIAVEQTDHSQLLNAYPASLDGKYALIFGNEAFGVSEEVLPHCDLALEIPQFGTKHSLNISVTIGIVLWSFLQEKLTVSDSLKRT